MNTVRIHSISEFHRTLHLPPPAHPLISVVAYADVVAGKIGLPAYAMIADYYSISVKRGVNGKMLYGQQEYDYEEGVMYFLAPGQVLRSTPLPDENSEPSGWIMLIHPDFLWNTPLANSIRRYEFFGYAVNEALFLSAKEEAIINALVSNIQQEYSANIDPFSQGIIIAHLATLLNYAERFYQRQFLTRKVSNHRLLDRLEALLRAYFNDGDAIKRGLPSVQYLAGELHVSPNYLSSMLKTITGQNTQQLIHEKLIDRAKEFLSSTDHSVSEIAYELGFEHPQSFSKLFKSKTNQSPAQFRSSFN